MIILLLLLLCYYIRITLPFTIIIYYIKGTE